MSAGLLDKTDTTEIVCDVAALHAALADVSTVVPKRSPKPILQNVLLKASPEGTTLSGTDLEVGVRVVVNGVKVERPIKLLLPTQRFNEILSRAIGRSEELTIAVTDTGTGASACVKGRGFKFDLPLEDPGLYPEIPEFPEKQGFSVVETADLRKVIARTIFATDVDSNRYALGGCLVESDVGALTLVGTDGRRLGKAVASAAAGEGNKFCPKAASTVAPVKALKLIERLADPKLPAAAVTIIEKQSIFVRTEKATVYSRLLEGRYPRYQDVFPAEDTYRGTARLTAGEFLSACNLAAIMTSEESRGVDVRFSKEGTTYTAKAADKGAGEVEMSAEYEGETIEITFDPRYLIDALKVLDGPEAVALKLVDGKNAAVLTLPESGEYTYVVMPLTRDR